MASSLTGVPEGVTLSPLARDVFLVLQEHTAFPWPVLSAQCKRLGFDVATLSPPDLVAVLPLLAVGVGRFTSPAHEAAVRAGLQALLRPR
jgi:hypothetical protein